MGEERLIEITSEICRTNDPLWTMGYVYSLGESDMYLLFRYISNVKYQGMNLYDALFKFSLDYLSSKNIVVESKSVNFAVDPFAQNQNFLNLSSSYFSNMMEGDNSINKAETRKGR